ncbi:MAG: hypothetical protein SangKO_010720 [Sandaracinaceae bacterium]
MAGEDAPSPPTWVDTWSVGALPRMWVLATFRPSTLARRLCGGRGLARPFVYALLGTALTLVLSALATWFQTEHQLERFGASDALSSIATRSIAATSCHVIALVVTASGAAALVMGLTGRDPRLGLRARWLAMAPITHLIAWWLMFRVLQETGLARWAAAVVAIAGLVTEWLGAVLLRDLLFVPLDAYL